MREDQFEILLKAIDDIKDSVESLKGANADGKYGRNLSDVVDEISSVESSVSGVHTAINELKSNIDKLSR